MEVICLYSLPAKYQTNTLQNADHFNTGRRGPTVLPFMYISYCDVCM